VPLVIRAETPGERHDSTAGARHEPAKREKVAGTR
jgi:hypothetical protein